MHAPPESRHHYEMGITRAEFMRLLPGAVRHAAYRVEGNNIAATGGAPGWRILLEERPGRRFGHVELPVLSVTLLVGAASNGEARTFVDRFLLGFQRAGG
jgi:hypothetical protein